MELLEKDNDFLRQMAGVFQYDPNLVDSETFSQLLEFGYITKQDAERRQNKKEVDLQYFYTGVPTI